MNKHSLFLLKILSYANELKTKLRTSNFRLSICQRDSCQVTVYAKKSLEFFNLYVKIHDEQFTVFIAKARIGLI